jgi:hypothetical protein
MRRCAKISEEFFGAPLISCSRLPLSLVNTTITSMTLSAHHLSPTARPSLGWPRDCARSEANRKHQAMPINTRQNEGRFTPAYVAPLEVGIT